MHKLVSLCLLWLGFLSAPMMAQEELMDLLEDMEEAEPAYAYATFKTVRIVNSHSVEMAAPGVLQMVISHRFGRLNGGAYELFGLDQANIRLGLEYGVTPWLNVGFGRSNVRKTYDFFTKFRVLRQQNRAGGMPLSVNYIASMQINTLENSDPSRELDFNNRLSYAHQVLIARKFSDRFSLQLMPTLVHRNLVALREDDNDVFAMGLGGRLKLTPSLALNGEYYVLASEATANQMENSFSLGIDIETGGHVFQLLFTNSLGMTENLFVAETDGLWGDGDIHFGFNITRVFTVKRRN